MKHESNRTTLRRNVGEGARRSLHERSARNEPATSPQQSARRRRAEKAQMPMDSATFQ